jgi:methionyl-tRNA formyltransferase
VRGLSPYPAAWTNLSGKVYKIFTTQNTDKLKQGAPGNVFTTQDEIFINTGDGVLKILDLQVEGKKRMKAVDFLRGNKI